MNKEELKQEAEESAKKFFGKPTDLVDLDNLRIFKNGYLAGAEPREKRITDLEATNKKISNECHKLVDSLEKKQKENAELKSDNDARKFAMAMSEKVEKQLREENAELRKEWQEQVQKATDEGYARTLQTIQLTKAKFLLKQLVDAFPKSYSDVVKDTLKQAEQFLKDSEVEK